MCDKPKTPMDELDVVADRLLGLESIIESLIRLGKEWHVRADKAEAELIEVKQQWDETSEQFNSALNALPRAYNRHPTLKDCIVALLAELANATKKADDFKAEFVAENKGAIELRRECNRLAAELAEARKQLAAVAVPRRGELTSEYAVDFGEWRSATHIGFR